MGIELALLAQVLVGLALSLPTILAASFDRAAAETSRRVGRYVSTAAGRGRHALYLAPTRS